MYVYGTQNAVIWTVLPNYIIIHKIWIAHSNKESYCACLVTAMCNLVSGFLPTQLPQCVRQQYE